MHLSETRCEDWGLVVEDVYNIPSMEDKLKNIVKKPAGHGKEQKEEVLDDHNGSDEVFLSILQSFVITGSFAKGSLCLNVFAREGLAIH